MSDNNKKNDRLNKFNSEIISIISEREKELNCLYEVEETLQNFDRNLEDVFANFLDILPYGFQYINVCEVRIIYNNKEYSREVFRKRLGTSVKRLR